MRPVPATLPISPARGAPWSACLALGAALLLGGVALPRAAQPSRASVADALAAALREKSLTVEQILEASRLLPAPAEQLLWLTGQLEQQADTKDAKFKQLLEAIDQRAKQLDARLGPAKPGIMTALAAQRERLAGSAVAGGADTTPPPPPPVTALAMETDAAKLAARVDVRLPVKEPLPRSPQELFALLARGCDAEYVLGTTNLPGWDRPRRAMQTIAGNAAGVPPAAKVLAEEYRALSAHTSREIDIPDAGRDMALALLGRLLGLDETDMGLSGASGAWSAHWAAQMATFEQKHYWRFAEVACLLTGDAAARPRYQPLRDRLDLVARATKGPRPIPFAAVPAWIEGKNKAVADSFAAAARRDAARATRGQRLSALDAAWSGMNADAAFAEVQRIKNLSVNATGEATLAELRTLFARPAAKNAPVPVRLLLDLCEISPGRFVGAGFGAAPGGQGDGYETVKPAPGGAADVVRAALQAIEPGDRAGWVLIGLDGSAWSAGEIGRVDAAARPAYATDNAQPRAIENGGGHLYMPSAAIFKRTRNWRDTGLLAHTIATGGSVPALSGTPVTPGTGQTFRGLGIVVASFSAEPASRNWDTLQQFLTERDTSGGGDFPILVETR